VIAEAREPAGCLAGPNERETKMFSQTVLCGRLGNDPEARTTSGDKRVVTVRLCTTSFSKGKKFDEWHTVVAWGDGLVGLFEKHLQKGDMILVTGSNRTRTWEKDGQKHYTTEVVMGPNDTVRFIQVKGFEADDTGPAGSDTDEEIPF
jgi:single-strand DNA-binding protein